MAKIGRNEPCICGSGKKYKQCCLYKKIEEMVVASETQDKIVDASIAEESSQNTPEGEVRTVHAEVEKIKKAALDKRPLVLTSGVLILFSTEEGDSWLLEATEKDALQLTDKGEELDVLIEENPDTTMVEWSHTFSLQKDQFIVRSYKDKKQQEYDDYPVKKIGAAMKGIQKRIPAAWAGMIHVPSEP